MLNTPKLLQLISANFLWWKDMTSDKREWNVALLFWFFTDKRRSAACVWKEPQSLWNRRELKIWCIDFFLASWGCWDMKMPFWGKLIACSATKSKIPLFSELQFPEVHCSSKAVITMQHVLKEHHYTFHGEKGNLSIAAPWLKKKI